MTRKKSLKDFTERDLIHDLAYRLAEVALEAMLGRMPLEKPTAKKCPKCGKRISTTGQR